MEELTCSYNISYEIQESHLICKNHNDIIVESVNYFSNLGKIPPKGYFSIRNNNYLIDYTPAFDKMRIYFLKPDDIIFHHITTLPMDPNLTPENFEQKIKIYLNFQ
jgi:hypothetical protein